MRRIFGKVGCHIGQKIGSRVADLIECLFGNHRRYDQAAGALGLGDDEASVASALRNGIADIVPIGHFVPIAEGSAGRLRAAFQNMADQTAGAKAIIVIRCPVEFVHEYAERKRAVGAPAGNDDVGAAVESRLDGKGAEIGVRRQQPRR